MPEYVWIYDNTSVIRQKGEFQNRYFKKTKHVKFSEKQTFVTHWYAHVRKIWRALFSWNTRFEIRLFVLIPTNRQDSEYVRYTTLREVALQVNEYLLRDKRLQNPVKYLTWSALEK